MRSSLRSGLLLAFTASILGSPTKEHGHGKLDFSQIGWSQENGGTTGGKGGSTTTVTSGPALVTAVAGHKPKIVYIKGNLVMSQRAKIGNNTSLIGIGKGATIDGFGLQIDKVSNVIVRNLGIHHCIDTDAISATYSNNIWIDHNEFWSQRNFGFDYYDGLVDVTKGSDYVTISWNYFHSHWKTSLVGGDPDAVATESGKYHISYHHNYWRDLGTRTPALRFSTAHVFNNYYQDISAQGIHPRSSAQVIIEGNVFRNVTEPISTYGKVIPADSPNTSPEGDYEPDGYANIRENDFGGGKNNITQIGNLKNVAYRYRHIYEPLHKVEKVVLQGAGRGKI